MEMKEEKDATNTKLEETQETEQNKTKKIDKIEIDKKTRRKFCFNLRAQWNSSEPSLQFTILLQRSFPSMQAPLAHLN